MARLGFKERPNFAVSIIILTFIFLSALPVSARNDPGDADMQKIDELEARLRSGPENYTFDVLNQLRHLYSGRDERKAVYYCDEIFRISSMDGYTLDVLSDWKAAKGPQCDPRGAIFALETKSAAYPEFRFVRAACLIRQGELFSRLGEKDLARARFEEAFKLADREGMQTYKSVAGAMIRNIDIKASSAPWTVPVLEIRYFPLTADGTKIDISETSNVDATLSAIRAKCDSLTDQIMNALEEGSRFRAYKNPDAKPSLRYRIVETLEFLEPLPHNPAKKQYPDYRKILERAGIKDYVEKKGVREVWLWGYHSPQIAPWESNMASPCGDISNSDRDPEDLPVLNSTYTVYNYNYQRAASEAVENHMHQIESLLAHYDRDLFCLFTGSPGNWRCGNCHYPPNGRKDYDWANKGYAETDIEDWRPDGTGESKTINCDRWGGDSLKWFIYWMQSVPGENNGLKYKGKTLTNWWVVVGDYDAAVVAGDALAK